LKPVPLSALKLLPRATSVKVVVVVVADVMANVAKAAVVVAAMTVAARMTRNRVKS
jgi:thiamine monophosphate kinase